MITEEFSSKSLALLFYLIVNHDKCYTRDYLGHLLWPGSHQRATYSNLRYNLWKINSVFKHYGNRPVIHTKNDRIGIIEDFHSFQDILSLKSALHKGEVIGLKKLNMMYTGEFLEGFYLKKCLDYNDWIFFERESYQRMYYELLQKHLSHYEEESMDYESIEVLEKMLQINPFNEQLYQQIISIFLRKGDKIDALNYYNKCIHTLREHLNISPKDSTRRLLDEIKNHESDEKDEKILIDLSHVMTIDEEFYLINTLLKALYEILGDELRHMVSKNILSEISKLCMVFESLIEEEMIVLNNLSVQKIRILDAVNLLFQALEKSYKIKVLLPQQGKLDKTSEHLINELKGLKNVSFEV